MTDIVCRFHISDFFFSLDESLDLLRTTIQLQDESVRAKLGPHFSYRAKLDLVGPFLSDRCLFLQALLHLRVLANER